jgi:hypothetical protein
VALGRGRGCDVDWLGLGEGGGARVINVRDRQALLGLLLGRPAVLRREPNIQLSVKASFKLKKL